MTKSHSGRCPLCGGQTEPGTTIFAVDLGFGVVVVRDVPAIVCSLCGEAEVEDSVAERLESIVTEAKQRQTAVEVTSWHHAVA